MPQSPARTPFERRNRTSARLALYGSLVLVFGLVAGMHLALAVIFPPSRGSEWVDVDFTTYPEVERLRGFLRVDTTRDRGDEEAGARYLASILEAEGIPYTLEVLGNGHANLWAILEGRRRPALVLHNHLDTDPVTLPETWEHEPFGGEIEGPYVYGRGVFDMKSVAIAQLEAFLELARRSEPLERSVIFLATGSEESGSDFGMRWILSQHPDLADRFWGMLTEGGVVETRNEDDIKYWGIEFAQRHFVDVFLCSPHREPLEAIREELTAAREKDLFDVQVAPEVEVFLSHYGPTRDHPLMRERLADPRRLALDAPAFFDMPIYHRAMLHDEAPPYKVEEAPGGGYRLQVKFHLLPGSSFEEARRRLLPDWQIANLDYAVYVEGSADHGSPLDHPLYAATVEAIEERYPEAVVGPMFLPWTATDSRWVRARGIPSYGFSPFLIWFGDTMRIAREDERMHLGVFVDGVELYGQVVERLVSARGATVKN